MKLKDKKHKCILNITLGQLSFIITGAVGVAMGTTLFGEVLGILYLMIIGGVLGNYFYKEYVK